MFRAVVLGARLGFSIDAQVLAAIARLRAEIGRSAPARLVEEYYKVLRSGAAARAFHELGRSGLLAHISPEIAFPLDDRLRRSLEALDRYRARFVTTPDTLANSILLGSILVPLGLFQRRSQRRGDDEAPPALPTLGMLPVARRDVERLGLILSLQRRLQDLDVSPRARASLVRRPVFRDALTWLEIHGDAPDAVDYWREAWSELAPDARHADQGVPFPGPRRRRRRRRRSTA
jgi:poly(A) polymerase